MNGPVPGIQFCDMAESSHAESGWIRLQEFVRKNRAIWWTAGAIFLVAVVIVILWKVPELQVKKYANAKPPMDAKEQFSSENAARQTLATTLGGLVFLAGAYFTWRNIKLTQESVATAQKSLMVSQEGQITDRFTKAIEQIGAVDASGKKKLEVRLGGIYALERIANQSERDHWPIIEVLSAYVRENARAGSKEENPLSKEQKPAKPAQDDQASTPVPRLAADIQAILTVLGRRDRKYEQIDQRLNLSNSDCRGADLSRADLREANLIRADLRGADLSGALKSNEVPCLAHRE